MSPIVAILIAVSTNLTPPEPETVTAATMKQNYLIAVSELEMIVGVMIYSIIDIVWSSVL